MTKEELERIKQAYNSGLKVQIWFNGYWKDFDIRDYSMYAEPFSEHRQYRIVGSAYVDIAEKRIEELDMKRKAERQIFQGIVEKKNEQLTKATELLRFWVDDFYDSFKHSNKYEARHKALVETEQFLKEIEK